MEHVVEGLLILVIALALACGPATVAAQAVKPVPAALRYNVAAETRYLLERCGELTAARREWLDNVRMHALRGTEWSAGETASHDAALKREYDERYPAKPGVERCAELAQNLDNERATTLKVP